MTLSTKAIRISENGGPEKMVWEDIDIPSPPSKSITIKHTFVGLNYIDTYHRSGLYPLPLPSGLGMEASGIVTSTGEEVSTVKIGDRVAYVMAIGSYSSARNIEEDKVVKIPPNLGDEEASAIMLKGMTVEYLVERLFKVNSSHTVLFHAVAGGVGLIACQWLKNIGARVIGTAGSEEKADLAKKYGCDEVILYKNNDFVTKVKELTNNGVQAALPTPPNGKYQFHIISETEPVLQIINNFYFGEQTLGKLDDAEVIKKHHWNKKSVT